MKTKIAILFFLCLEITAFGQKVKKEDLPNSYDFTWRYTQQITNKEGIMLMHYFFKEDQLNFGSKFEILKGDMVSDMFTIMDYKLNTSLVLINMGAYKIGQIVRFPKTDGSSKNIEDYKIDEIGEKEILGYRCKGIQYENKDYKMIMYYAMDAPVSFNQLFQNNSQNIPEGINMKLFKELENSMVMEMEFTHKKKKKFNSKIICIALEKEPLSINISDYKFMGF
jgi:Domain of unknown function (DUF4412)